MTWFNRTLVAACAAVLAAASASAQPIIIGAAEGAVFDGVLDGFPMIAANDGVPDFGGNALGLARKAGSTEERGIGEFPLDPLDGVAAGDIAQGTLTFNIDDVLTTFGPGTEFTGAACEEILIHLFAGDGAIQVDDYLAVERAPHVVDTRPFGRITDATLRSSGLLVFEVDVTDDVRALVAEGALAIGVVWRTEDTPTGTSLDNLGDGAAGPPGVNNSFMPYLTVELGADETATPTVAIDTPTPTPTSTPIDDGTPTATVSSGACAGDCNADLVVSVNELITGVNLALGNPGASCAAMDPDGDGMVGIAELVRAVGTALSGC